MKPGITGVIEASLNARYSARVREALDELSGSFTVTDPGIPGQPIVYANAGFAKMSGYSKEEVVGRNGRMFQGPGTCESSVMKIRDAVREEKSVEVCILNYRKDGSTFWLLFRSCPIFSEDDGSVVHFGYLRETDCHCNVTEKEKDNAADAMNSIVDVLISYSKSTGKVVSARRDNRSLISALPSSVHFSLGRIRQSFVLTDPHLPDMPIVYASEAFLRLTGYERHEVVGRNCRILSGVDTDPAVQMQIKESIRTLRPCSVRILNYRKDNRSFWNLLHVAPVRNATGKVAYFVGVQVEEGSKGEHLSVVGAVKVAVRSMSMVAGSSK